MTFIKPICPRCGYTSVQFRKTDRVSWCRHCGYEWQICKYLKYDFDRSIEDCNADKTASGCSCPKQSGKYTADASCWVVNPS